MLHNQMTSMAIIIKQSMSVYYLTTSKMLFSQHLHNVQLQPTLYQTDKSSPVTYGGKSTSPNLYKLKLQQKHQQDRLLSGAYQSKRPQARTCSNQNVPQSKRPKSKRPQARTCPNQNVPSLQSKRRKCKSCHN